MSGSQESTEACFLLSARWRVRRHCWPTWVRCSSLQQKDRSSQRFPSARPATRSRRLLRLAKSGFRAFAAGSVRPGTGPAFQLQRPNGGNAPFAPAEPWAAPAFRPLQSGRGQSAHRSDRPTRGRYRYWTIPGAARGSNAASTRARSFDILASLKLSARLTITGGAALALAEGHAHCAMKAAFGCPSSSG